MRSRYGRGAVVVRLRSGHGTVAVRSWNGRGAVTSWYGSGAVKVLSRYAPDSLVVLHTQGSFTPAILAYTCLEPSTCTIQYIVCSTVAVRSRYTLGTLPVHSWYGTLKVRSRLLFSPIRASNLVHALYNILFVVRSRCGQGTL